MRIVRVFGGSERGAAELSEFEFHQFVVLSQSAAWHEAADAGNDRHEGLARDAGRTVKGGRKVMPERGHHKCGPAWSVDRV